MPSARINSRPWVIKTIVLALSLAFAITAASADDFDDSSYRAGELVDAVAGLEIDPRADYWLDASHAKYNTDVTFTGAIRPIDLGVKRLIVMWTTALRHPESVSAAFKQEVQVSQDGQTYWMPIQDVLVEPWEEEMHEGSRANVYLLLMGAHERAPVFTIAGFSAKP
jgi:hypothetical protein